MDKKYKNTKTYKIISEMHMKDDPLYFLIHPLHFGMKKRICLINVLKGVVITYLQIFNVIGLFYICKNSQTYLHRYISGILLQQVGISSYALMMYYIRDILHLSEAVGMYFLPFNAMGTKVHQEIINQYALSRKMLPLGFLTLIAVHSGLLPIATNVTNYQFTLMFIEDHFGAWSPLFQGLYYICILSSGYSIGCLCCVSTYLVMHLKFQFHLLVSYIQQISSDIGSNKDTALFQYIIQKKLISFVQAHDNIKTLSIKFLDIGKWSVLVTTISCSCLYTSLLHFMTMDIGPIAKIFCVLSLAVAFMFTYIIVKGGQQLQDESTNLYMTACQCKWTDWNIQNQRTLLMIIINTSKTVKMTSFGIFDFGNEIMLRILRLTYSLILLFLNK